MAESTNFEHSLRPWPFSKHIFSLNKQPDELIHVSKYADIQWVNHNILFAMTFLLNFRVLFNYLKWKLFMLNFCCHFWNVWKWIISLKKQQEKLILRSKDAHVQWVNNTVLVAKRFEMDHRFVFKFLKRKRFTFNFFSKFHD